MVQYDDGSNRYNDQSKPFITLPDTVTIVDSFEDGDISEYSGDTAEFSVVNDSNLSFSAIDGNYVLERPDSANDGSIESVSGLNNYFPKGSVARCHFRTDTLDGSQYISFAHDGSDRLRLRLLYQYEVYVLESTYGGLTEVSNRLDFTNDFSTNEWFYAEIERDDGTLGGSDNDIRIDVYRSSDDLNVTQASIDVNTSDGATEDGIGFATASTANLHWDYYNLP
jgi:hypothetical protein